MSEARSAGLCVVSGSTYPEFAEDVAAEIGVETTGVDRRKFSNGELFARYKESLRGKDVFIFQSHDAQSTEYKDWSINDAIQEQVLMVDAAAGASAEHITAVCTHFGYARQDKKDDGRVAIGARRVARQLVDAGAGLIISMDLHSPQIQGFTNDQSFENLYAASVLLQEIESWAGDKDREEIVVVAPDVGRAKMAAYYARKLGASLAILNKDRSPDSSRVRTTTLIGEVAGRHCVIVDDMIDTAKTLGASGDFLQREDAASVIAVATHAI